MMRLNRLLRGLAWLCMALVGTLTAAPLAAQNDCPADYAIATDTTVAACTGSGTDAACFGHGQISITHEDFGVFAEPGDVVSSNLVRRLSLGPYNNQQSWGVVTVNVLDGEAQMILVGEVSIENEIIEPPDRMTVTALRELNLHEGPGLNYPVTGVLEPDGAIEVDTRNATSNFLRGRIGNERLWVPAGGVRMDGLMSSLLITGFSPELPAARPLQIIDMQSAIGRVGCDGLSESGLIIQSPRNNTFIINDIVMRFSGTIFVQAMPNETNIHVFQGQVTVNSDAVSSFREVSSSGGTLRIPTGFNNRPVGPAEVIPYDAVRFNHLPLEVLNNSPRFSPNVGNTPCFIRARASGTITPRQGPGYNRSSPGSLSSPTSWYQATAQGLDDNGLQWLRVSDRVGVGGGQVGSFWLPRSEVFVSGACDTLARSNPQGDTTNVRGGRIEIEEGNWRIVHGRETRHPTSCDFPRFAVGRFAPCGLEQTFIQVRINHEEDGDDTILVHQFFAGQSFTLDRVGDNLYGGEISYAGACVGDECTPYALTLQVISPTFMRGELTLTVGTFTNRIQIEFRRG